MIRNVACLFLLCLSSCSGAEVKSHSACYVFVWNAVVTCVPEPDPSDPGKFKYHIVIEAQ